MVPIVPMLRRLDTAAAAALVGFCASHVAQAWLCADASCRSAAATVTWYLVTVAAALTAGLLLWRFTRRWWSRLLAFAGAAYAAVVAPPMILAQGRWPMPTGAGQACAVSAGTTPAEVHRGCGAPEYACVGPKLVQAESGWDGLHLVVCDFQGDVYGDHLITYGCRGGVAAVDVFDPHRLPPGCWARR